MLAVRNRAIDGRGLSPPRSAALLAAPTRIAPRPPPEPYVHVDAYGSYLGCLNLGRDRDRARPAVGEGFPFPLFRLQAGFTVSPWRTFLDAPPIMPDGRI